MTDDPITGRFGLKVTRKFPAAHLDRKPFQCKGLILPDLLDAPIGTAKRNCVGDLLRILIHKCNDQPCKPHHCREITRFRNPANNSEFRLLGEIPLHHAGKLVSACHPADARTERPPPGAALGVAAGELPHQDRSLRGAEPLDHQAVMVQQQLPLLGQAGIGRDRLAAQSGRGLAKSQGRFRRRPADHHAVDPVAAEGLDHRLRRGQVAVADQRNAAQVRLDAGDLLPIGRAAEHVGGRAAVDRQRRPAGAFHRLGHVDGVDRVAGSPGGSWPSPASGRQAAATRRHDLAHAVGITQQIRAAVGLFRDVADRAAEIDVHHADAELVGQPPADCRQRRGIVVPDLHGQRPRLVRQRPIAARAGGRRRASRSPRSPAH